MAERRDLPLFAWRAHAEMLHLQRARALRRARVVVAGLSCVVAPVVATTIAPPAPRLVWNASASAPIGLYGVSPRAPIARGDMVIAWAPRAMRRLAAQRHYLPQNIPLVKRVVAVRGDRVCASGNSVSVQSRTVALRRVRDGKGRPMPTWSGCLTLGHGTLFLMMVATPDSFDGRYFGPTASRDVIGKATPLWLR